MLTREDVIDICKRLNFDPEEYCLGFGGALVLYGVKDSTADVDINVTGTLFSRLSEEYKVEYAMCNEPYIRIDSVVDVFIGSNMNSRTYIEGIPVAALQAIIESKSRLGRPKDIEDVKCIEKFIDSNRQ